MFARIAVWKRERFKAPVRCSGPWLKHTGNVFYRVGIIETWGRETLRIMELLAEVNAVAGDKG